jgi:acyl-coenzyme A synthetase/AMP-(fatty) acid ligase
MTPDHLLDWAWLQANRGGSWPRFSCSMLLERSRTHPDVAHMSAGDRTVVTSEFTTAVAAVGHRLANDDTAGPVVVLVERSVDSAVGILGTMWSGRCVVPVSAAEPVSRIAEFVERTGAGVVIDGVRVGVAEVAGRPVVPVGSVGAHWCDPVAVPADDLVLVMFTSGSTGRPKGIVRRGWQEDTAHARMMQREQPGTLRGEFGPPNSTARCRRSPR